MRSLIVERRAVPAVFVMALAAATAPADGWQSQPGVETELQDASPDRAAGGVERHATRERAGNRAAELGPGAHRAAPTHATRP